MKFLVYHFKLFSSWQKRVLCQLHLTCENCERIGDRFRLNGFVHFPILPEKISFFFYLAPTNLRKDEELGILSSSHHLHTFVITTRHHCYHHLTTYKIIFEERIQGRGRRVPNHTKIHLFICTPLSSQPKHLKMNM